MVRRTKEDALATRASLLDAAERLFQAKGVSRTSLNDIALEAGTTRGAIYWHFKDKADLFNAMMARVTLPLESAFQQASAGEDPLPGLRECVLRALRHTAGDEQTRRVFEVRRRRWSTSRKWGQCGRGMWLSASNSWTRCSARCAAPRAGAGCGWPFRWPPPPTACTRCSTA